jgi:hypothetical protein
MPKNNAALRVFTGTNTLGNRALVIAKSAKVAAEVADISEVEFHKRFRQLSDDALKSFPESRFTRHCLYHRDSDGPLAEGWYEAAKYFIIYGRSPGTQRVEVYGDPTTARDALVATFEEASQLVVGYIGNSLWQQAAREYQSRKKAAAPRKKAKQAARK